MLYTVNFKNMASKKKLSYNLITILVIFIPVKIQKTDPYATITATLPQIVFQPLGKLVTQFTYANIKIHIYVSSLYDEVNDLFKVVAMLLEGTRKIGTDTITKNYIHSLTKDIDANCPLSTKKLNGITKTFGFTTHKIPPCIPNINVNHPEEIRNKRQIIAGIIAMVSIVSLLSAPQLVSMADADDDDIITNQNHIISAIQNELNRLSSNEDNIGRLKEHIAALEKNLFITNSINSAFISIISIKEQTMTIINL